MGCWNKTCGLTRLPIMAGDEVYTFVLERNTDRTDRCYSTAFWRPVMLPFVSKYNDYGGGEESDEILKVIMVNLDAVVVPLGSGGNSYHEHEVKREVGFFTEERFFDLVHENRVFVSRRKLEPITNAGYESEEFRTLTANGAMVDFVMLHKGIVDQYLAETKFSQYVGSGKGTTGYDNNYIQYTYTDLIAAIPTFFEDMRQQLAASSDELDRRHPLSFIEQVLDVNIPIHAYIRRLMGGWKASDIVSFSQVFKLILSQPINDKTQLVMERFILSAVINELFETVRVNWAPGGHEGSQTQAYKEHLHIAKLTSEFAQKQLDEYGSDE